MRIYKKKNFIGKKIGKLKVLEELPKKGVRRFVCRCDCSNGTIKSYGQLVDNLHQECKECYKKRIEEGKIKTRLHQKQRHSTPLIHNACGKLMKEHKKCRRCKIILCSKTNKNINGYCKECNIIKNETKS